MNIIKPEYIYYSIICDKYMLFTHHFYGLVNLDYLILKLFLLVSKTHSCHADGHFHKHILNSLFIVFELLQCFQSLFFGHEMCSWWLSSNFGLLLLFDDILIVFGLIHSLLEVFRHLSEILVFFRLLSSSSRWRPRRHSWWFCRLFRLAFRFLNSLTISLVKHFLGLFVVFLFILFNYMQFSLALSHV